MLGAWGGHVNAVMHAPEGTDPRTIRRREVPLAVVMVALTTLTLWSLGQAIVVAPPETPAASAAQRGPLTTGTSSCRRSVRRAARSWHVTTTDRTLWPIRGVVPALLSDPPTGLFGARIGPADAGRRRPIRHHRAALDRPLTFPG